MRDKDGKPLLNNYRVRLWQAVITPKRFDYFKATRSYLPAADIQNPAIEGINPFSRFDGGTNGIFHNIDLAATIVAASKT